MGASMAAIASYFGGGTAAAGAGTAAAGTTAASTGSAFAAATADAAATGAGMAGTAAGTTAAAAGGAAAGGSGLVGQLGSAILNAGVGAAASSALAPKAPKVPGGPAVPNQNVLLATLRKAFEYAAPGEGNAVVNELKALIDHREMIGWVLFITMLFFSSLGFKVLENAISVIFLHRLQSRKRHFIISLLLPFGYNTFIAVALFAGTFTMVYLLALGDEKLVLLGHSWSMNGISRLLINAVGIIGEILLISAIYYFMPVGQLSARHALIGGATAGLLWEFIRHALGWYFGTLSQVGVVYGSLTTAIIVLLSFEVGATLLLLGAQVIAEYERIGTEMP